MRKAVVALILVMLLACGLLLTRRPLVPEEAMVPETWGELAAADFEDEDSGLLVAVSHPEYFYGETIDVTLSASDPTAGIFYSLDGSEPTVPYESPLHLAANDGMECAVVKAVAVKGEQRSAVLTHSYFVSSEIDERFDTLVFSLSTDEDNLYSYENGILVAGKLREDFMAELTEKERAEFEAGQEDDEAFEYPSERWEYPANHNLRGRESERETYVEVFTAGGERVVGQSAGLRVHGSGTRRYPQKSLRLIARSAYEAGAGHFDYEFFPGYTDEVFGAPITQYNALILRNGGNDRYQGMIRNEVGYDLAAGAGDATASPYRAAAVFLNGEYYGFTWLQIPADEHTLQDLYAVPERTGIEISQNFEIDEWLRTGGIDDLTDDAMFEWFCDRVDMDALLFYYAYEVYVANFDWPSNNMRFWAYTSPEGEAQPFADELDGKYRPILFDAEYSMGLDDITWDFPTMDILLDGDEPLKASELLAALLEREDVAESFANMLCDMAWCHLTYDHAEEAVEKAWAEARHELGVAVDAAAGAEPGWTTQAALADGRQTILDFFARRSEYIMGDLRERLGYSEQFRIVAKGNVAINTSTLGEGRYFVECAVPVTPALEKGEVFDHWLVNGEVVDGETLTVTADMAVDGVVQVELVSHAETPALEITGAWAAEGMNGCTLRNNGGEKLSLKGLYLTDDPNNLTRWAFPDINLAAGREVELVGNRHTDAGVLLKLALDFNLSLGETLILSDAQGNILDWMVVAEATG